MANRFALFPSWPSRGVESKGSPLDQFGDRSFQFGAFGLLRILTRHSEPNVFNMNPLHAWNVSLEKAIQIQESFKDQIILKKTFSEVRTIGGGDVAYSRDGNLLYGSIVVLSFPEMEIIDTATADGKTLFPYIPGFLSFREGPILIKTFQRLRLKPDVMIYDGQGIAHPRGMGLSSHMGLWLDLPSIGCAKTPLLDEFDIPRPSRGSFKWIRRQGSRVGAVLRTKENVNPLFVSPGHRIDFLTSNQLILESCKGFRFPEPLRKAHQLAERVARRVSHHPPSIPPLDLSEDEGGLG